MAVGIRQRCPTETLVLPLNFPGGELSRDQVFPNLCPVQVITDYYGSTDSVWKSTYEVDLLGSDSAAVSLETDQSASHTKRSGVNIFTSPDRGEILGRPL